MNRNIFIAVATAAAAASASPAMAAKADEAWAACIWEQVPASASNWLKMPVPKRGYGLAEVPPEYVLQFRLQAACYERLTPPGKERPPAFSAKAVRKALLASRPAGAAATDKVDPLAYRCVRYFVNDAQMKTPGGYEWGFGTDTTKAQFFSMTFLFAAKGGSVGLPQQGGLRKCSYIQADGTFRDA
jgi:hypothetical protein